MDAKKLTHSNEFNPYCAMLHPIIFLLHIEFNQLAIGWAKKNIHIHLQPRCTNKKSYVLCVFSLYVLCLNNTWSYAYYLITNVLCNIPSSFNAHLLPVQYLLVCVWYVSVRSIKSGTFLETKKKWNHIRTIVFGNGGKRHIWCLIDSISRNAKWSECASTIMVVIAVFLILNEFGWLLFVVVVFFSLVNGGLHLLRKLSHLLFHRFWHIFNQTTD